MNKLTKAIFIGTPKNGTLYYNNPEQYRNYLYENEGIEQTIRLTQTNKQSEKIRMYAYYEVAIIPLAIMAFTNDGYIAIDPVSADYMLKARCAKKEIYNEKTGEVTIVVEDKKDMNKTRLYRYINDCILILEHEYGMVVMDSDEYKRKANEASKDNLREM